MQLTINHQIRFFEEPPLSLEALITAETRGKIQGIAVAINNQVIPRTDWHHTKLFGNEKIIIISATQGG